MARPKLYTVHLRAWSNEADRDAEFVREGFSWGAFVFSVFWALWNRLWIVALLIAGALAALALAEEFLEPGLVLAHAISLAVSVWIGFEANDWRRESLKRRGYAEAGIVAATSLAEAEFRFFSRHAATPVA